jgi:5-methylcytosine-specific restriction endonuclease McrA
MPWEKTAADRKRDAETYGSPEYKRNRAAAVRRAGGRCEQCGHRHPTQCDHVIPVTRGGGHGLANLRMLCAGEGTCKCHEAKTAQEGGGYRASRGRQAPRDPQPRPRTKW